MTYSCLIVGGGIVGLATAYRYLESHPSHKVLLLEKESALARHQTGNNSGVIHAGGYYRPGSFKARLAVEGGRQLVEFCRDNDVPHSICGKVIVATSEEELPRLEGLAERAKQNGLDGCRILDAGELRRREPAANGLRALYVPMTGIIDYGVVSETLARRIRERGGEIRTSTAVTAIRQREKEVVVRAGGDEYRTERVIACAGLHADRVAGMDGEKPDVRIVPFRGEYFKVREDRKDLVKALIYPVPDPQFPFLGVHFTRMIDGGLEAGPNAVLALKREGYSWGSISVRDSWDTLSWPGFRSLARTYWKFGFAEFRRSLSKPLFVRALQKLVPDIQGSDLVKGGAGVRAQACDREGKLVDDFFFLHRGRVLHVLNAPSPAATASLAIGSHIVRELDA